MKKFIALPRWTRASAFLAAASGIVFLFVWQQFHSRIDRGDFQGSARQLGAVIAISIGIYVLAFICECVITRRIKARSKQVIAALLIGVFTSIPTAQSADGTAVSSPEHRTILVPIKVSFDRSGSAIVSNFESQLPQELSAADRALIVKKLKEMVNAPSSLKPGEAVIVGPEGNALAPKELEQTMTAAQAAVNRALAEAEAAALASFSGSGSSNLIGIILLIIAIALIGSFLYLIYLWAKYLIPGFHGGGSNALGATRYHGAYSEMPGVMLSTSGTQTGTGGISASVLATESLTVPFENLFSVRFEGSGISVNEGTNYLSGTVTVTVHGQEPFHVSAKVPVGGGSVPAAWTPVAALVDTNPPPQRFFQLEP